MTGLLLLASLASAQPVPQPESGAAARLSKALQFKTVSTQDPALSPKAEFEALHKHIEDSFPLIRERLKREKIGETLLYTWLGKEPALKPALLLAHLDVVPVEPGTESKWEQPPFSGAVAGGFIWGRGAIDDKGRAWAILEAVEGLLKTGYMPTRTILISLGHDEEVGGAEGAKRVAALLAQRKTLLEAAFDEGGAIVNQQDFSKPVARIMVAEKGYLTVELVAHGEGGHSSMPPKTTAVGRLARAVERVETHPFPARLTSIERASLNALAKDVRWPKRLLYSHPRLFSWFVRRAYAKQPPSNALIRTTIAPTIVQGGIKDNVLPTTARAVINLRLLPGDTIEYALKRLVDVIDDPLVSVSPTGTEPSEASAVSDPKGPGYAALEQATHEVMPDALVAPALLGGASDARHFQGLTSSIYRFRPWRATSPEELKRFHGANERVSVSDLEEQIRFYSVFIPKLDTL